MDGEGGIVESCILMIYVIVFSGLAAWIRGYSFNSMGEFIASNIRYDLFYSIINKDIGFFDENKTGEILSRITSDTSVIQDGLGQNVSMLLRYVI